MSVIFMWCGCEGSPRKFAQPTTRTIPLAHDSGLPRVSGEGRLRARTPASFRHKAPYSASRWSRQKASVRATIRSCACWAFSLDVAVPPGLPPPAARFLGLGFLPTLGASTGAGGGNDVTIPNRSLASL